MMRSNGYKIGIWRIVMESGNTILEYPFELWIIPDGD